jgi:uncharacterized protein YutE (UPF0331/DUF86 family)
MAALAVYGYVTHDDADALRDLTGARHRLQHRYPHLERQYGARAWDACEELLERIPATMSAFWDWMATTWPDLPG